MYRDKSDKGEVKAYPEASRAQVCELPALMLTALVRMSTLGGAPTPKIQREGTGHTDIK